MVDTERVGDDRFSTQHLMDGSEQVTLSNTCETVVAFNKFHKWQTAQAFDYLFTQQSGKDVHAFSRAILARLGGGDRVKQAWRKKNKQNGKMNS